MDDRALETLVELQSRLMALKLLPRTGWLQRGLRDVESVAEHSFGVATLALVVGDLHPGLDRAKLLSIALLHDLAEALIGDLPASARRLFSAQAKQSAERKAMGELFGGLPQEEEYLLLWEEYAQGASAEARLVKVLDRIEMLAQALSYERAGARNLGEFWDNLDSLGEEFPEARVLAERLFAERERPPRSP